MSHKELHCLWSYFICQFPDSGYFSTTWLPQQVKQISANKGNFLLAELRRDFLEVESKGYNMTGNRWEKKVKTMSGHCNLFNSLKPYSIKRDLSQLQGCWRQLKLQSKKDHDLDDPKKLDNVIKSEK